MYLYSERNGLDTENFFKNQYAIYYGNYIVKCVMHRLLKSCELKKVLFLAILTLDKYPFRKLIIFIVSRLYIQNVKMRARI